MPAHRLPQRRRGRSPAAACFGCQAGARASWGPPSALGLLRPSSGHGHHGLSRPGRGNCGKIPSRSSNWFDRLCCWGLGGLGSPPASSAWPGCWSSGIFAFPQAVHHLSGSRKRAKETLVPRMFTSLPSTSVNLKFSVLRVIGPRSSTRCPSSVWSFMTWPTPLSMITLQIMSVLNGPRIPFRRGRGARRLTGCGGSRRWPPLWSFGPPRRWPSKNWTRSRPPAWRWYRPRWAAAPGPGRSSTGFAPNRWTGRHPRCRPPFWRWTACAASRAARR